MTTRQTKKARAAPRKDEIAAASKAWRDNGGPIANGAADRDRRERQQIARAVSQALGVDVDVSQLHVPDGNVVFDGLEMITALTGSKVLQAAIDEMTRLGLDGLDWRERSAFLGALRAAELPDVSALQILADLPDAIVDRMTAETVEKYQRAGMSERAAMDATAVEWSVPASGNIPKSEDGMEAPRQEVKRRLSRDRERASKREPNREDVGSCASEVTVGAPALKQPRVSRTNRHPSKVD